MTRTQSVLRMTVPLTLIALAACGGPQCWRIGYERSGASPEEGRSALVNAMDAAARDIPAPASPPRDAAEAAAANELVRRRIAAVRATMTAQGYAEVKLPVDCETGAPK
ncbi:MAG: hypothetical protein K8T90_00415 [Planctomycetes bacterium]|nr:hypothetical protein [Planctomycetota bacterium]